MRPNVRLVGLLWTIVGLLVLIGVATVIRRAFNLTPSPEPARFPEAAALDRGFYQHPRLTRAHILPGFLFMVLGPLQFIPKIRRRRLALHRWSGRVFIAAGIVVGISALIMSPQMAIGGVNETVATMLFALLFLFALSKAFFHIRRREVALHREWMIRAFRNWLGRGDHPTDCRSVLCDQPSDTPDPTAILRYRVWLGFTLHAIAAEIWINYTRSKVTIRAAPAI